MAKSIIAEVKSKRQAHRSDIKFGERFGRLTVIEEVEPYISPNGVKLRKAKFLCDCGTIGEAIWSDMYSSNTRSCGCLQRDSIRYIKTKHGLHEHPIYNIWMGMKDRCNNPNSKAYDYYGSRGISICQEWEYDFKTFFDWAISNGWRKGLIVDRRNVNRGYNPGNCRFVDVNLSHRNTGLIRSTNKSGYRGVSFNKEKIKWQANINCDGKRYYLGCFIIPEEAARAYDAKAIELDAGHPLNFPKGDKL